MGRHHLARAISTALVSALLGAACTGGEPLPSPTRAVSPSASRTITPPPFIGGGQIVFGAEQWPECLNPITACGASDWTWYTVLEHVLPRAMQLDPNGNFVPSPLLVEAPSLTNGGISENPFKVTFRISPTAVWEDGSPITSADIAFTGRAILNTKGSYEPASYAHIQDIDSRDPSTAILTFDDVYVDWPDLFGGARGFVLKQAAFTEADQDRPNLKNEMMEEIPFSGGPFRLASWSTEQAVLTRNDRYSGPIAHFDQVTFVPRTEPDKELRSVLVGEVAAIYPDPFVAGAAFLTADSPYIQLLSGNGTAFEALWFDHSLPPLDDPMVREALMYAVDRQAIVDQIVKIADPGARVLNCGFVAFPNIGPWCQSTPFIDFTYDPNRARSILESDGYDCSAKLCQRDGAVLEVDYSVPSTNTRLTATQELVIEQAREAGFLLRADNYDSTLLTDTAPFRTLSEYATGGNPDPSVTRILACEGFRSESNPGGGNVIHWCDPEADWLMRETDRELDPARRLELFEQLYEIESGDFVSLPLYVVPAVSVWRIDQITGPIGLYNSSPYGLFFNMNEWGVAPPETPEVSPSPPVTQSPAGKGGSAVFGAEQWPECLNPITACAASDWTWYTALEHALPRAMQLDPGGNFEASPLLAEAPTLANGGLTQDPFTVTFRIAGNAVWEDGARITAGDFDFTWRAILGTAGSIRTAGYDLIESIDWTDPSAVVIRFKELFVDWPDLFGGTWGFVLKRSAFPQFAASEKLDLKDEMMDNIPFSGGPFRLASWSRKQAVLVRNDNYFGPLANLDRVTFLPTPGPNPEAVSIFTGGVAAIYPSFDSVLAVTVAPGGGNPAVEVMSGSGTVFEALWFRLDIAPLDDPSVREALMYAIDRQAVVDQLVTRVNPTAQVLNCGFLAIPNLGPWCENQPFAQFNYDPEKAKSILEADGYDCSPTPCRKGGKQLEIEYTHPGDLRHVITYDILKQPALEAGFDLELRVSEGSVFGTRDRVPFLAEPITEAGADADTDPTVTDFFGCDAIPTKENDYKGQNHSHWCDWEATFDMKRSDLELDPPRRLDILRRVYDLQAEGMIGLPLYVVPALSVWRTDQIDGPIGLYNSSPYGLFFNMNEWYVPAAA